MISTAHPDQHRQLKVRIMVAIVIFDSVMKFDLSPVQTLKTKSLSSSSVIVFQS